MNNAGITEEEYQKWKVRALAQPEHERLQKLIAAVSPCVKSSTVREIEQNIAESAIYCVSRLAKEMEEEALFLE